MATDFQKALRITLNWEGGFVDDPDDRGGATNFGITTATYDGYRDRLGLARQSVKEITMAEVEAIYHAGYWNAAKCPELKWPANMALFDLAVNSGVTGAAKVLQAALKVKVDGKIGPVTLAAARAQDPVILALDITDRRDQRYVEIVKASLSQVKFLSGWLRRTAGIRRSAIGK